jgi:ubiquinone/menaquinone biosynthesis C-methylase UbiE
LKVETAEYDGIPVFLRFSNIDAEISAYPDVNKAVELARTSGWRSALETVYGPDKIAYSVDSKRSKFLDLLPLSKDMTALEIGIGLGQHTAAIASRVSRLDTLELRLINAIFAKIRCTQEGVSNVTFICGGDDCRLPFPDASYDAVILNLVLEWCASANPDESAPACQYRLLSEIHRVLKPNGFVQLSTKNRFAYRLLIGSRDEHTHDIPFGSALPRWLLRLILRAKGKNSYPGYLHSYSALKKLLRSIGLTPTQSYWAVPEMRFAVQFIPTDAKAIRMARRNLKRQSNTRATELLMRLTPAALVKYFTPGLFFIAYKK